jgi:NAD(P)-dependent dehydrogenase (short-subunit alcohol dehydrogenase family)
MWPQTLGLEGRLIVVTGGLGILGWAVAKAAMDNGAIVALLDRVDPADVEHDTVL